MRSIRATERKEDIDVTHDDRRSLLSLLVKFCFFPALVFFEIFTRYLSANSNVNKLFFQLL